MSLSDYAEAKINDELNGKTAYTMPTIWIGLSTADPGDDGATLAEPVGNGYARVETSGATWNAGALATNAAAIMFPTASGSWGTISHVVAFDAVSGGNIIRSGALTAPTAITTNQIARFATGALTTSAA